MTTCWTPATGELSTLVAPSLASACQREHSPGLLYRQEFAPQQQAVNVLNGQFHVVLATRKLGMFGKKHGTSASSFIASYDTNMNLDTA